MSSARRSTPALSRRPGRRPGLEQLGAAIEDSLDLLPDDLPEARGAAGLRAGALAAAAMLGAWLALGHGVVLP